MNLDLPKGIYYEAARKRYRVRLYKQRRVVHRSYHTRLEDAQKALNQATAHRGQMRLRDESFTPTVTNLLQSIYSTSPFVLSAE